jgi:IS1 family transposase
VANHLSCAEQLAVLHMLVEGNSLRSITRLTGIHRTTIINLMMRVGALCREFSDRWMRNLTLAHLECDEIWTFVLVKQAHIPTARAADNTIGDQYLFIAIDEDTKLIPSYLLGKRTAANAVAFAVDLAGRLVLPDLFDTTRPRPRLSTDGFNAYPGAVETAFGGAVDYGVIIKDFVESEQPGRYGPPDMVSAIRQIITGHFSRWDICTSHVERHNLSIRTFMRRFTRLALGFSKKLTNLEAAIDLYVAHYNFCRLHGSLNGTPAMAAGIAGHPWTLAELLDRLDPKQACPPSPAGLPARARGDGTSPSPPGRWLLGTLE